MAGRRERGDVGAGSGLRRDAGPQLARDPEEARAFWRRALAGFRAPTPLPGDGSGSGEVSRAEAGTGARPPRARRSCERRLSRAATARLLAFAGDRGLAPATLVEGAWALVLARGAGVCDVVFGAAVRQRADGSPVGVLPVRLRLGPEAPAGEWLAAFERERAQAHRHAVIPLDEVLRESEVTPGRPLFESLVVCAGFPVGVGGRGSGAGGREDPEDSAAEAPGPVPQDGPPLVLVASPAPPEETGDFPGSGERLRLRADYDAARLGRAAVETLLLELEEVVAGFVVRPETPLGRHRLLPEEEVRRLLALGERRVPEWETPMAAHRMVAESAEARPEAVALAWEGGALSYGELVRRTRALAARLRGKGVGPEVLVALAAGRSPELVVGLVAILEAGGAYLPLDPTSPLERLGRILEDARPRLLLADRAARERLAAVVDGEAFELEAELIEAGREPERWGSETAPVPPERLAYVIFTSGSTGRPKGVMVPHRGLANLVRAQAEGFAIDAGTRILQFASIGFDASVSEIFKGLGTGATLVLPGEPLPLPGGGLLRLLENQEVTVVTFPPSLLTALPEAPLPALATLVVAGEACPPGLAERFGRGRRFIDAYGPTEATVCATFHVCEPGCEHPQGPPIGGAMANVRVRLLDRFAPGLPPVGEGIAGEIALGGPGLARGYLGRPATTAAVFVPDPHGPPGERLYRTGDLARRRPGGELDSLGRIDRQVKVRGYRIEPGEVEAALVALPGVREAAVVATRPDGSEGSAADGERRLAAWLVLDETADGTSVDAEALRRRLVRTLPEWMIPTSFAALPALPRSASGKIDRRCLEARGWGGRSARGLDPGAGGEDGGAEAAGTPPGSELERWLAGLWAEILGVGAPAREESFFELGGDSIHAAILLNRLEARLGEPVYVTALFDSPTLAGFAAHLGGELPAAVEREFGAASLPAPEAAAAGETGEAEEAPAGPSEEGPVTSEEVALLRRIVAGPAGERRPPRVGAAGENPRAVFILSPPRSGSTLLRVLLGGSPRLFAPPELELLGFETLAEREAAFSGRFAFWLEGTMRALMETEGIDGTAAARRMEALAREGMDVPGFYRLLQDEIGDRLLVDKTPSYSLEPTALERAEAWFEEPLFVHLVRHPYGMLRSFEDARLDQVFFRWPHGFGRRRLGELVWRVGHENVLTFLAGIPEERRVRISFEELVRRPEATLGRVARLLGVEVTDGMLSPYGDPSGRMTDGVHPLSKMLGDVKFHRHSSVDPAVAERWRGSFESDFLAEGTWELAERLGYEREPGAAAGGSVPRDAARRPCSRAGGPGPAAPALVTLARGDEPAASPLFLLPPAGGSPFVYRDLAAALAGEVPAQPVLALAAPGFEGGEPAASVEAAGRAAAAAIAKRRPRGPLHLVGWSYGGYVAWETARRLTEAGREVEPLVLLDAGPSVLAEIPERDEAELLVRALWEDSRGEAVAIDVEALRRLKPGERLREAAAAAESAGVLPAGFALEAARRRFEVYRAAYAALRRYRPRPWPGSVTLVLASDTAERFGADPELGWGGLAGSVEVLAAAAPHLALVHGRHSETLAPTLVALLAESRCEAEVS